MTAEEYLKRYDPKVRAMYNSTGIHLHIEDVIKLMDNYAEHYHQEKMKQHDALVKMMAQDEKEGNYQEKMKEENKCKCKVPNLRMKVSENGISGYCTVCLKQS